jgi:hypothetical protein
MPFTCEGAGSLWPDVAWHLALLAPNLAPADTVSRANVRMAGPEFRLMAGSRGQGQGYNLQSLPCPP